jgi:hypothetical protein
VEVSTEEGRGVRTIGAIGDMEKVCIDEIQGNEKRDEEERLRREHQQSLIL